MYTLNFSIKDLKMFSFLQTHFKLEGFQFLLSHPIHELLAPQVALFNGKLCQRVAALGTVPLHHAQGAAATAGHAGEALAPREEEHLHLVELHIAPPRPFRLLKDGRYWRKERKTCYGFVIHTDRLLVLQVLPIK